MEFIKKYWYIILVILMILIIVFITYNTSHTGETYIKITQKEAEVLMKEKDTAVIDVRTKEEYKEGHIEKALNIPYDQISDETIKIDKNKKIIVYCRTGVRSRTAAEALVSLGYTKVYDMGGLNNWAGKITTE